MAHNCFWHFQRIFIWDWKILVEKSLEKLQIMKLGSKHSFQKKPILWSKVSSERPKYSKNWEPSEHKNPWNNKKARCLTNESQLLFKPRKFLKNRISNDLSVEAIRYSKWNWGKMGESSSNFQQRCQSLRTFFNFRQHISNFGPFPKFTSIRKTIGSGLKRVATSSDSKRYQMTSFAQL